jgi:aryl-alcohol dehydrogenase-like predicted oxidoreductase
MMTSRLAIGTVQFGQSYGIANNSGQVTLRDAAEILQYARSSGVDTVDTAIAYGESEQRLGEIGVEQLQIVSKLPAIPQSCRDVHSWVYESVEGCLGRLKIPKLHGLLLHRPEQLFGVHGVELYRTMRELKIRGFVEKIGISIYGPDELDTLWPRFRFDIVQAPFSIVDRRMADSGWFDRLRLDGAEIHVRSIFLQGLLLMSVADRPPVFDRWSCIWQRWHAWLEYEQLTPLQACLGFALSQPEIDRVVVGVDSLRQLQAILDSTDVSCLMPPENLMCEDENLINPSRWRDL